MQPGKHFELWDINADVIAKGEFLEDMRVVITEEERSDEKPMKEYDTLRDVREDYAGAYCAHIPKQGSVEDHDDKAYNIVIPPDDINMDEVFIEKDEENNASRTKQSRLYFATGIKPSDRSET